MGKTYFRFFNKNAILSIHVFVQGESVIIKKCRTPLVAKTCLKLVNIEVQDVFFIDTAR